MKKSGNSKAFLTALSFFNILLMAIAIIASVLYAHGIRVSQETAKKADFISTVESMKSVSQTYLDSERGYVEDWAAYINDQHMTLREALDYLKKANTNPNRFAHIVDMETLDAWSAYYPTGDEEIETYHKNKDYSMQEGQTLSDFMMEVFQGTSPQASVIGRYPLQESLSRGFSVGARINLQTDAGEKGYLLLRAIPADAVKDTWVFPAEYQSVEVGIITKSGNYMIQATSMKSNTFPEYIQGYNFQEDYNRIYDLLNILESQQNGILHYKDFRGNDCLWYFSSFGEDSNLDIIGMVREDELTASDSTWLIVLLICGTLAILIAVDGVYLWHVNVNLRKAAQLAKQASEAKTQFLSAMSHDIRTPLNAVLGMMSIAQRNTDKPEYAAQCLEKGMNAGKRLLTLINDVLDISRIESERFVLTPVEMSIPDFSSDLVDIMKPQAAEKQLTFTAEIARMPHPTVMADPIRLNQIYMNLLSNAVKYTPPGGSVDMALHQEDVPGNSTMTRLVFRVADTGIGMSPEYQKQMYNSFTRAINTQVNKTQGSGLGLSIVRQMVDLMKGSITCDSVVGKGTVFTVSLDLPIADAQSQGAAAQGEECSDVSGLHLLVAEDNELNWEIIQVLLSEMGVSSQRAVNGQVCVEMLCAQPPGTYDAILMDIQMPVMNGIEACRQIRALPDQRSRIPIVAMTADAFAEDVQVCLASGMNGHLAKPINIGKLQDYLKKISCGSLV